MSHSNQMQYEEESISRFFRYLRLGSTITVVNKNGGFNVGVAEFISRHGLGVRIAGENKTIFFKYINVRSVRFGKNEIANPFYNTFDIIDDRHWFIIISNC